MTTAHRTPLSLAIVGAAALLLAACGGGSAGASGATTSAPSATTGQGGGRFGGGVFPGASGLVAAVDGTTLQVQGGGTQTAVTWTASTRFTSQVPAKLSDVRVGSCVMVRSSNTGATPQPPTVQAVSVAISPSVAGTCDAGAARGGRARPSGSPSGQPTGTGRPGGARGFGGFGGAFGIVKSVSGTSFTVDATTARRSAATATATPPAVRTVQVTTTSATTYTKTIAATAKAAAVGTCVVALGKADDTGAISATSVTVRPAVNGACAGVGGRGFGGPAGNTTGTTNG
ncbi:hypothetical protein [Nostocoides sp. HKS02]|uniref:hypothetical protein n=1 Tax=Nostocoides sp. HKS02 TaxID=1813880 RepID=UPI0012B4BDAD|nr:hypothetical protein [Tetrasphaera sp. HKS02]QGN57974.1 hypothetical protein GKE56_08850 [Tetrasphaera sp. HKS02]